MDITPLPITEKAKAEIARQEGSRKNARRQSSISTLIEVRNASRR